MRPSQRVLIFVPCPSLTWRLRYECSSCDPGVSGYRDPSCRFARTALSERLDGSDSAGNRNAGPESQNARSLYCNPVRTAQIESLFLTHLHSDHILGVPDVIFTSWVFGRSMPLKLYGPAGTSRMTEHFIAAFAEDIRARTEGLEGAIRNGYRVRARDIRAGIVYDSAGVRIRAIPTPHNVGIPAFAYRIDTPDRSVVISGDTGPSDVLLTWARGVDVLVHEVVNMSRIDGRFPGGADIKTYMRTAHTPVEKLAQIAARTNPRVLVLTHIVPAGTSEPDMIKGIQAAGYRGRVAFGHDLDRF